MHGTVLSTQIYPQPVQILAALRTYFEDTASSRKAAETLVDVLALYPADVLEGLLANDMPQLTRLHQLVATKRAMLHGGKKPDPVSSSIWSLATGRNTPYEPDHF